MAIFRGDGGAGDSNNDATLLAVTQQAVIATTKASDAAASAVSASDSATTATNKAAAASTSATNAANSATGVAQYATAAANSATASANSATAAATSATEASTAETNAETAETNAETAESNASTSAATATTKASEAATSASSASTSASTATTKASEASTSASNASTSESNAATSASGASTSATNASNSATAAGSSASGASTSATNASNSASAASTSETNAGNSETAAASSASTASTAATSAGDSATAASGSASTASTQASAAATSATNASTSETNASTSATNAATSETNAETAKTNAETAEANAETAETNAAASATTATTKASEASTSATSAATSETNASNSASAASTSAATATTKASEASTSATNAATSASTATTQATNASTSASSSSDSATSAGTAQTAAEAARDAALAAFDSFDDRYLGQKSVAPTTDNDGNPLVTGTLYFNTTSSEMKVWDGSAWLNAYASLSGAMLKINNLSDLNNAGTSRTNLGLGTAATTASTDYATAAQGTKVDGIEANADVTDTANVVASLSAGTGIGLSAGGAISNTAPDQTVALTGAGTTSVSGTYPNFTITGTGATYTAGSGLSLTGTVFANTAPDQTVALTGSGATSISGTYPNFTISSVNTTYSVGDGGLSQINFTSADHTKLNGIATGATNVTNNNQLTNGRGFVTSSGNTVIGTDSDINTSGAIVVDQLNMTDGVIQSHSTRTMTLANLGYTGATNANNYSFPYTIATTSTGNAVARRDASGDINARLFRSEYDSTNASCNYFMTQVDTASNNYMRPSTPAQVRSALNVANGANNYSFPYTVSTSAGNNTVVQRHASGYIFANYFNTTPNTVSSGVTQVCVETGNDGYIRHGNAAAIKAFIGLGAITTPTLTSPGANQIKLTNRSSYGSPNFRIKRGSANLLYTEDRDGVITITGGTTATGNQTISVQVFDFGGTSSTATVTVTLAAAYRYYRLTSFSPVGTAGYMTQFRLNSGLNGTSPIVISDANFSASFSYSGYPPANANNATGQGWWPLGHSGATYTADWIKIDAGSSIVVASLFLQWNSSYWSANATLQGSDDGSSWTTMKTITGMTAGSSNTVNI